MEAGQQTELKNLSIFVKEFIFEDCVEDDADLSEKFPTAEELSNELRLIEDLDGDSLMMLSLLREITKTYKIDVDLDELGRKLIRQPASTVGEIIKLAELLVTKGSEAFS